MILNTEQAKRIIKRDIWRSYKKCPYCAKGINEEDFENMRHNIEVSFWDEFHENYIEED